jgi:hypothetical protein
MSDRILALALLNIASIDSGRKVFRLRVSGWHPCPAGVSVAGDLNPHAREALSFTNAHFRATCLFPERGGFADWK